MLSSTKPFLEKKIDPFIGYLAHISPNILTLLGSIPPLLFFVFVLSHWYLAAFVALLGIFFDFFDGMVARKYHKVTLFGALFDSTLDRVADFFLITAFAFGGIVRWEIVLPLLLCSFLISYIRGTSEKLALTKHDTQTKFAVGLIERPERLLGICLSLLLALIFPTVSLAGFSAAEIVFLVLVVLSVYTIYQRIMYAYKNL